MARYDHVSLSIGYNTVESKLIFLTEYQSPTDRRKFASYVIANNKEDAQKIVQQRKLDEKIISQGVETRTDLLAKLSPLYPNTLDRADAMKMDLNRILHHSIYLAFLNIKAGESSIDEWLADDGILHELIHHLSMPGSPELIKIDELIQRITKEEEISMGYFLNENTNIN